jgi:hypothetical protein
VMFLMWNTVLQRSAKMKHIIASLTIGACLVLPSAGTLFATGQPGTSAGVNCGTPGPSGAILMTPGNSAASPGAPFNEPAPVGTGAGGKAGQVYAGSGVSAGRAGSPNAVSQYDVACLQVTQMP